MWMLWESLKHGVKLKYWTVRWKSQDLNYLERTEEQSVTKGGGVALVLGMLSKLLNVII